MTLSTHVLDGARGQAAAGVGVRLDVASASASESGGWLELVAERTDADGRVKFGTELSAGVYRLVFDTGAYFDSVGTTAFYPEVSIAFTIADSEAHYHVPLLLSPFAYSTYRGS
jgi:5-hydroxyisourate hydrolase